MPEMIRELFRISDVSRCWSLLCTSMLFISSHISFFCVSLSHASCSSALSLCVCVYVQARIGRVVYGARSTLLGAHGSWVALLPGSHSRENTIEDTDMQPLVSEKHDESSRLISVSARRPHPYTPDVPVRGGVLADECGELMRTFFRERSRGRTVSSSVVDVAS